MLIGIYRGLRGEIFVRCVAGVRWRDASENTSVLTSLFAEDRRLNRGSWSIWSFAERTIEVLAKYILSYIAYCVKQM